MFIFMFFSRPEIFVISCHMADVYFMFFPACDVSNSCPHGFCLFRVYMRCFKISRLLADVCFMFCLASDPL